MKSEIAWLMEAFLEEDPKKVRIMIKDRMAEVTQNLTAQPPVVVRGHRVTHSDVENAFIEGPIGTIVSSQSPSMQRIMQQNPELIPRAPEPVTPAAAQALIARQELLNGSANKGRTSPRKI